MKCARCHDAPYHDWTQRDLFSIAAMLANKPVTVPETSSVPDQFFSEESDPCFVDHRHVETGRARFAADWPLDHGVAENDWQQSFARTTPTVHAKRLAFQLTRPENRRFAETIVNRLWRQLLGEAIVEPDR